MCQLEGIPAGGDRSEIFIVKLLLVQASAEPQTTCITSRSHLKNPLGCGSLRYEIASSSGENVLAVSQRIHLRAFSPCILALS
jgi:hypothetical protein